MRGYSAFTGIILIALCVCSSVLGQGLLNPPGAPVPTMKTLGQLEPREIISSLPYTISDDGTYCIIRDLVGQAGTNGITIAADSVMLDLNGFSLIGVSGSEAGVHVANTVFDKALNIRIQNGVICNWGAEGINAEFVDGIFIMNMNIFSNSDYGIKSGGDARIDSCNASYNLGGMWVGNASVLEGCTASYNTSGYGIYANEGSSLIGCASRQNSIAGFHVSDGSMSGCASTRNAGHGIMGGGSTLINCSVDDNGGDGIRGAAVVAACQANSNDGDGIWTSGGSLIRDCRCEDNGSDGIESSDNNFIVNNLCQGNGTATNNGCGIYISGRDNRIEANNVVDNDIGIYVKNSGNLIVRNSASGNTTNYVLDSLSRYGPIETDLSGVITNLNPWTNFEF